MVTFAKGAVENRLLAHLSRRERQKLLASCERVELRFADVLCNAGERIRHVHFPIDSCTSLVTTLADGARLEVGIVGYEGMVGTSLILGIDISPQQAVVQCAGSAWRMSAVALHRHLGKNIELRRCLNGYVYVLMAQLSQTSACTHYHLIEARLARWLLMTRDRTRCDQFHLTHEYMAYMLGVRRVGVTKAAGSLLAQGLIEYRRGEITILDGAGLGRVACACYQEGKKMYERTLGAA